MNGIWICTGYSFPFLPTSVLISIKLNQLKLIEMNHGSTRIYQLVQKTSRRISAIKAESYKLAEGCPLSFQSQLVPEVNGINNFDCLGSELVQQIEKFMQSRNDKVQQMHEMVVSAIEMVVDWMNRSVDREEAIMRLEKERDQREERVMEELQEFSMVINKLNERNIELSETVEEVLADKIHYQRLYQDELFSKSQMFGFKSESRVKQNAQNNCKMEQIWTEEADQEDNNHMENIIKQLRIQINCLKKQRDELTFANKRSFLQDKVTFNHELSIGCITSIPTQSSIFQEKKSLALDVLPLTQKLSEAENGCFSYLISPQKTKESISNISNPFYEDQPVEPVIKKTISYLEQPKNLPSSGFMSKMFSFPRLSFLGNQLLSWFVDQRIKKN